MVGGWMQCHADSAAASPSEGGGDEGGGGRGGVGGLYVPVSGEIEEEYVGYLAQVFM